jgi:hypothetical protein
MKNINNLDQLKSELQRLQLRKQQKESDLKDQLNNYAGLLKPANLVKSTLQSAASDSQLKKLILSKGSKALVGFVVSTFIFKNPATLYRAAATLAGTTLVTSLLERDGSEYMEKFKSLFSKFKKAKEDNLFDEKDIYNY